MSCIIVPVMRIAIFELEHWEREVFDELSGDHEVRYEQRPLSRQNVESFRDVEIASPFIYSDLSSPVLEAMPELRMITTQRESG